jgi:hypothetical protein
MITSIASRPSRKRIPEEYRKYGTTVDVVLPIEVLPVLTMRMILNYKG